MFRSLSTCRVLLVQGTRQENLLPEVNGGFKHALLFDFKWN